MTRISHFSIALSASFCPILFWLGGSFLWPGLAFADQTGVVLLVGSEPSVEARAVQEVSEADLSEDSRSDEHLQWHVERVVPEASTHEAAPIDELDEVRRAYVEGDGTCTELLQEPSLDVDRLLSEDHRAEAAEVVVLHAACLFSEGETEEATAALRPLFVRELDGLGALRRVGTNIAELAGQARAEVMGVGRIRISVVSDPPGARVVVDGGARRCDRTPCVLRLLSGLHMLRADLFGYGSSRAQRSTVADGEVHIALYPADRIEMRTQLSHRLASSSRIDASVGSAAANALGADRVALVWVQGRSMRALIVERDGQRVGAGAVTYTPEHGALEAIQLAFREAARGSAASASRGLRRPWLAWTISGAVLAIGGAVTGIWAATRPTEHTLVFGGVVH